MAEAVDPRSSCCDRTIDDILDQMKNMHKLVANERNENTLPIITVSFAQSLNGMLAPFKDASKSETTSNYPLSGEESMRLTHAIRSLHDGILIGGRTLALDNPRLNNRLWNPHSSVARQQPIPVALDSNLHSLRSMKECLRVESLIVCCSQQAADSMSILPANVRLCPCPCGPDGRIDIKEALAQLWLRHDIKTLMVEGGAQVISSLFNNNLVDVLCVTVAPKLLSHGIAPMYGARPLDLSAKSTSHRLGNDFIFLSSLRE